MSVAGGAWHTWNGDSDNETEEHDGKGDVDNKGDACMAKSTAPCIRCVYERRESRPPCSAGESRCAARMKASTANVCSDGIWVSHVWSCGMSGLAGDELLSSTARYESAKAALSGNHVALHSVMLQNIGKKNWVYVKRGGRRDACYRKGRARW